MNNSSVSAGAWKGEFLEILNVIFEGICLGAKRERLLKMHESNILGLKKKKKKH